MKSENNHYFRRIGNIAPNHTHGILLIVEWMIDVETRASLCNEKPKLFAGNIPDVNLCCAPCSPGNLDRRSGFLSVIL
jgi:hypothetical protein